VNISHLRIFRDIAQANSISRGAEVNSISQSAASQHLRTLEEKLGVDLLDRTTRPLKLTPAGRLYLDACRDIVRRYEEMESAIDSLKKELVGTVRVASIYSIGLYEMAQFKAEFESRHRNAQVHLEYMRPEKVYQAVIDDQADLGLVSYPTQGKDIQVIPWRQEQMVLVCHPNHRLAARDLVTVSDFEGQEFVSFDPDLSIRKAIDRFLRENGVQRKVAMEFDNIQMIQEAVSIGSGIAILPERTVRQEVADGRLVARPIDAEELVRPVGIVHPRMKCFSRAAAQFLEFLRQQTQD
jgi:DNA-binding transcriptional LysR family regulator